MTTYTTNLKLTQPNLGATGWGTTVNSGITALVDDAVAGLVSVDVTSGNVTLTTANGTTDQARNMFIRAFGASVARDVIVPAVTKLYFVVNDCTADVTFKVSAQTGVAVPAGKTAVLRCDGTDIVPAVTYLTELTTSGDVGIGTNAPAVKLDVVGGINLSDSVYLKEDGYLYSYKGGTINQGRAGVGCFGSTQVLTFITATNERMRIDASGNVGIGTNTPTEKLEVQGTAAGSAFAVRFSNTSSTANSAAVLSLDPGNNGFNVRDGQIHAINNGANQISLAFFTSSAATPVEAMRIDASGNVLVGTATANARLTVSGSVSWTTGTSFAGASGDAVWTTSFGSQAINASIQASDSIAGANIYAISDVRLKNNIRPIPSGLAFVNEVDAVQFTWKESGIEDTGFIAQDLLKKGFGHLVSAIPDGAMQELVHEDGNVSPAGSRFVVKYDSVVPILCKAIQEQQAVIEDLRARVAELESK